MITFLYFILVLGVTVFIHEFGHFIFAKKAGVYVYEFSLGMGPAILKKKSKKSETVYSLRLFPIGGFVQLAGEDPDLDKDIPTEKRMQSKTWLQKFSVMIAGILFNFLLAIILFFIVFLKTGSPTNKPLIDSITENTPAYNSNLATNDLIISLNGKKINDLDKFNLEYTVYRGETLTLEVKKENGITEKVVLEPQVIKEDEAQNYVYGFSIKTTYENGIIASIKGAILKVFSLIKQMFLIIVYLITGKISLSSMAGPVGIYQIVGETSKYGFINILYLIGYICTNVGFVNLIPIPAFDGGRILFLIIEKIKRKPINPKTENIIHSIGFAFLIALMIFITINDVIRIFG